jgi:O-antigen/teichoic acid export membrane protein
MLLVRRLPQVEFGLYKQLFLLVNTALVTLPIGFYMSAYYFLPREREQRSKVVFNIVLFNAVVSGGACALLLLRPGLLGALFANTEIVRYAPLVGPLLVTLVVSAFLETITIANQELRLATCFIVSMQVTKALFLLTAALRFGSVRAIVEAAILQSSLQTVLLLFYLRSRFGRFWRGFEWPLMRRQLTYALPLGFASVLYGCFFVEILSDAVGAVMIPRVSELEKQRRRREILELTARMIRKLAAVYFPLYALLLVTGREFITLLFTRQYLASWPIFAINLTLVPLAILATSYDPINRAYPEYRFFLVRARLALLAVLFVALWFGTRRFGLVGAISVAIGINLCERLIVAFRAGRALGVTRRDACMLADTGKLALAALIAGAAAAIMRPLFQAGGPFLVLVACALILGVVYVCVALLLGVMTPEEQRGLRRRLFGAHSGLPCMDAPAAVQGSGFPARSVRLQVEDDPSP